MRGRPPRSTRTDTVFPYTRRCRSVTPVWHKPKSESAAMDGRFLIFAIKDDRKDSITEALQQVGVGVDATVAQERPDPAHVLAAAQVDFGQQQLAGIGAGLGEEFALRAGDEARTPELDARSRIGRITFEAGAVAGEQGQA